MPMVPCEQLTRPLVRGAADTAVDRHSVVGGRGEHRWVATTAAAAPTAATSRYCSQNTAKMTAKMTTRMTQIGRTWETTTRKQSHWLAIHLGPISIKVARSVDLSR